MTLHDAIDILSKYSRWRKGTYAKSPSPQEFGEAVDIALERLTFKKVKTSDRERSK